MNFKFARIPLIVSIVLLASCNVNRKVKNETTNNNFEQIKNPTNSVLLASEITWEKLNPARGNQSPQAGTIWGDRNKEVATGFLAKFVD